MSLLRNQLRKLLPRFSKEANKIRKEEARSRWMKLRKITESTKTVAQACRFYGMSEDSYGKWGRRLLKNPRIESLLSKSRKPNRSPMKSKPRIEKMVLKVRRVEPYLGPERISNTVKKIYEVSVPPSTVFAILRRAKVVGKKIAAKLTKKHLKRYRRPLPGYLQMDFKHVPYQINGKQYYQLSCIDHHSSWRLIRCYRNKNILCMLEFLKELDELCPFIIFELQTDNDKAFTDKFDTHGFGVTGQHELDRWCKARNIKHRLIPVGVKELNGKVENTHKQDDREFFAMNEFKSYENIELSTRGYNDRWNNLRATKTLGWKTPNEVLHEWYVRVLAIHLIWNIKTVDEMKPTTGGWPSAQKQKNRTAKPSTVSKYLKYLEWADKKKLPAVLTYPSMSQNFSVWCWPAQPKWFFRLRILDVIFAFFLQRQI